MSGKMKISESIVYLISQLIFFVGRKIAQAGNEILPKASPKITPKVC